MLKFINILINFYFYYSIILSECIIKLPQNIENFPKWEIHIGQYWIKIPHLSDEMVVQNGEKIQGYCNTFFRNFTIDKDDFNCTGIDDDKCVYFSYLRDRSKEVSGKKTLNMRCVNDTLRYGEISITKGQTLSCVDAEWTVSWGKPNVGRREIIWCAENHRILILITKNFDKSPVLAYICFDINNLSPQAVHFRTNYQVFKLWNIWKLKPPTIEDLELADGFGPEIESLNSAQLHGSNEILELQLNELSENNSWVSMANYEYGSLVQSSPYLSYFQHYGQLIDVIWWHNLRVFNWRRFLNALQMHFEELNNYRIYLGTLGVIRVPIWTLHSKITWLEIQSSNYHHTIPAYIWLYMEPLNNMTNMNLYIFGYNSPYFSVSKKKIFNSNDVIFCPNICSELPWLRQAQLTFHFANAGIIFCCTNQSIKDERYVRALPKSNPAYKLNVFTTTSSSTNDDLNDDYH
ncbi:uncharacterized protein ACN427_014947 isoform 3-T3 [Glossina fuscipes fuscipes]